MRSFMPPPALNWLLASLVTGVGQCCCACPVRVARSDPFRPPSLVYALPPASATTVGVIHVVACCANSPPAPALPVESMPAIPDGVSHIGAACERAGVLRFPSADRPWSISTVGVGHAPRKAEPSSPAVAGTHVGRGQSDPLRIPPEVGQFSHDAGSRAFVKLAFGLVHNGGGGSSDACDVLQKHEPRTAIGGDANDLEEQPGALAVKAGAAACDTEVLAREAGNDAIHSATPCGSVEGGNVGPDRSRIHGAFFHARRQDCGSICFPLNVAYGAMRETQVLEPGSQSFVQHADAAEKADGM